MSESWQAFGTVERQCFDKLVVAFYKPHTLTVSHKKNSELAVKQIVCVLKVKRRVAAGHNVPQRGWRQTERLRLWRVWFCESRVFVQRLLGLRLQFIAVPGTDTCLWLRCHVDGQQQLQVRSARSHDGLPHQPGKTPRTQRGGVSNRSRSTFLTGRKNYWSFEWRKSGIMRWDGGSIGRASNWTFHDPSSNPVRSKIKTIFCCWHKCYADSLSVCPAPVGIHAIWMMYAC